MTDGELKQSHRPYGTGGRIGRRISVLVAVAVLIAVSLVTAIFMYSDVTRDLAARKRFLESAGYVYASALAEQVAARDDQAALKVLRSIQRIPDITYAAVLDGEGKVFAGLGSAVILDRIPLNNDLGIVQALRSGSFPVLADIIKAGNRVGQVLLIADISDLRAQLVETLLGSIAAALLAIFLGLIVANHLQRRITQPILSLTGAMRSIRDTRNYETKVEKTSDDETGVMVETFNTMIAEIRSRDRALDSHRQGLEATVADRTRELRDARDAAQSANQAKSSFLATMSHEIRTPLNGLMVMAELLMGAGLDQRLQRYAEVIVKSGQSLLTIINDILDLSKIEAGKLELERIPLDPVAVADDVTALYWERANSKGLDLAARVGPGIPQAIAADPVRLNQILSNLVNNALKFTEKGQVLISVQFDGRNLMYSVTDSGIGIPRQTLDKLFEAFSQADQSITRKFGGTGLGLAICKRLAEAMGGSISAGSELGQGSTFSVTIPASVVMPPRSPASAAPPGPRIGLDFEGRASLSALGTALMADGYTVGLLSSGFTGHDTIFASIDHLAKLNLKTGERPRIVCIAALGDARSDDVIAAGKADDLMMLPLRQSDIRDMLQRLRTGSLRGKSLLQQRGRDEAPVASFKGRRVLVADDNAINREVIIEVLRRMEIAVETAVNGREAVEAWRRRKPDLVFMDCSMPEMDGYAAAREIRAYEALDITGGHTPVIALTAHVAGTDAETWRNAGMDAYMTKPFTLQAIAGCLQAHFAGKPFVQLHVSEDELSGPEPVLDENVLNELRSIGGSDALFRRVLDLFVSRVPQAMETAEILSHGSDLVAMADAAHALKSMCVNIGARRAASACNELEQAARVDGEIDAGAMIATISREVSIAVSEVEKLRAAAA